MKSFKVAALYGLAVWVFPFVVAVLIFPLRDNERPLFESIMPVVLTAVTLLMAILYFQRVKAAFVKEGILLGILWLAISVVLDLLMFSRGPMAMALPDYIKDIGLTYLIIPAITIGSGYLLQRAPSTKMD